MKGISASDVIAASLYSRYADYDHDECSLYVYVFCIFDFIPADHELMEHATETAVEVVVMLLCASAMLTVFYYLFTSMPLLGVSMDTTVKESVELMVELICAFSVMAMLSLAMYTDVISRLLERLF